MEEGAGKRCWECAGAVEEAKGLYIALDSSDLKGEQRFGAAERDSLRNPVWVYDEVAGRHWGRALHTHKADGWMGEWMDG